MGTILVVVCGIGAALGALAPALFALHLIFWNDL